MKFPHDLISDKYVNDPNGKNWNLIRVAIKRNPEWVKENVKYSFCLFREIAYINKQNEIEGLGRAWIPFTAWGIKLFATAINPLKSRPIGAILRKWFDGKLSFEVYHSDSSLKNLPPYFLSKVNVTSYKRIITLPLKKRNRLFTEEDFVIKE